MNNINNAMKKLQESKRAQLKNKRSTKFIKESKRAQLKNKRSTKFIKESIDEPMDKKYSYKVTLDNGKVITATCLKKDLADAKEYFMNKTYKNTKTGESAKVVDVEENGSKETKNEDFGSKAKELNDNDPSMKKPYDSEANKNLQDAATKDAKIVAEEFGNKSKELNDNDPAQGKPYESDAVKDIKNAAKKQPKIVAEEFGSDAKELNDNDPSMKKPYESETKKEIDDATKGKRINNKIDESKKLEESAELSNEQKLEKAKQLIEVIFSMETLDETRHAAKKELRDLVFPQKAPEETKELPEKKIVKESIFDNNDEIKVKEDRLADLKTQLECDGDQLADDEKEAIQAEIDSLEKDLYESKQLKESQKLNPNNLTKEQLWKLREEIVLGSLYIDDYKNSFGINPENVCNFFDSFIEDAQQDDEGNYNNRETKDFDNAEELYNYYLSCENPFGDLEESSKNDKNKSKRLKENIANDGRTIGKTLEVIYTDKDGNEKTTHFECDKDYELDGDQIREAIKSSDNDIVDIIKINESKCLNEDEDKDEDESNEETDKELDMRKINNNYKNHKDLKEDNNKMSYEDWLDYIDMIEKYPEWFKDKSELNRPLLDIVSDHQDELWNDYQEYLKEDSTIEDIDDKTFTEAFTKFIKENYKNAKEFKLENVKLLNNGNYKFECKLVFNSGKERNVNLISNATIKEGKSLIRFYENKIFKHLDENKSIMTATVKLENKTLSCESLRYNYRVALKENKVATVKGIIK